MAQINVEPCYLMIENNEDFLSDAVIDKLSIELIKHQQ